MKNIIFSFLKWPRRQILFSKQIRLLTNKLAHKPVSGQHGQVLASEKGDRFGQEITLQQRRRGTTEYAATRSPVPSVAPGRPPRQA